MFYIGSIAVGNSNFGSGEGVIYLDNVHCTGNETSLTECSHSRDTSQCDHSEDVGVRCVGTYVITLILILENATITLYLLMLIFP